MKPGKPRPANVDKHRALADEVFSYREGQDGRVFLSWRGRQVMVLSARAAQKFLARLQGADDFQAQLLMARTTGNFKRGNER